MICRAACAVWRHGAFVIGVGLVVLGCSLSSGGEGARDGGGDAERDGDDRSDSSAQCTAADSTCRDGELVLCERGELRSPVSCPSGCTEVEGVAACAAIQPSHITPSAELPASTATWAVDAGEWTVNTDTGEIRNGDGAVVRGAGDTATGDILFTVVEQDAGPDLGVFSVASLEIEAGATLRGVGDAALVIVASGAVTIDGALDVSAVGAEAGPGGGERGNGGAGQYVLFIGGYAHGAGGGGTNAAKGGDGGSHAPPTGTAYGGPGGPLSMNNDALRGGGSGGNGHYGQAAAPTNGKTPGGGGGGAVQITSSGRIEIGATGVIRAHGAGGSASPSGAGTDAWSGSGGGGGAGGTVWLEAPSVEVLGQLVANGGGGGGGQAIPASTPKPGQDGQDGVALALGGPGANGSGTGGDGAAGEELMGEGGNGASGIGVGGGGGGGGGGGRITVRATAAPALAEAAVLSPSVDPALTVGLITP